MVFVNHKIAGYTILRIVLGLNMLMHGAVRLFGDYTGFAEGVLKEFSGTVLPEILVKAVGWGIPPVEFLIGLALILGLFTGTALIAGGLLMSVLVFGMSLLKSWGTVGNQMVYVLLFSLLLFGMKYNRFSIDNLMK